MYTDLNLDSMTTDELRAFVSYLHSEPIHAARGLFPNRPAGYVKAARILSQYAWNAIFARNYRRDGDIVGAVYCETACDRLYNSLPDFAKTW